MLKSTKWFLTFDTIVAYCSMGGLVVKQMLYQAKEENMEDFVKNTIGIVCFLSNKYGSGYLRS